MKTTSSASDARKENRSTDHGSIRRTVSRALRGPRETGVAPGVGRTPPASEPARPWTGWLARAGGTAARGGGGPSARAWGAPEGPPRGPPGGWGGGGGGAAAPPRRP